MPQILSPKFLFNLNQKSFKNFKVWKFSDKRVYFNLKFSSQFSLRITSTNQPISSQPCKKLRVLLAPTVITAEKLKKHVARTVKGTYGRKIAKKTFVDSRLFDSCLPDLQPIIIINNFDKNIKFHESFLINNSPVISWGQSEYSS